MTTARRSYSAYLTESRTLHTICLMCTSLNKRWHLTRNIDSKIAALPLCRYQHRQLALLRKLGRN